MDGIGVVDDSVTDGVGYAEFYYTNVLWPDFTKRELLRAIAAYQHRDRRFGGVKT